MKRSRAAVTVGLVLGAAGSAHAGKPPTWSAGDREAITRVAVAEAGNQGDSGLAAVVQTILNRLATGRWGSTIEQVVDAPHQFEPVARAGGDWRRLPSPSDAQRVRIDTILNLVSDGRMPDFIGGALYFQNPRIVAARVAAGTAPVGRLNFGGQVPVTTVGDHAFYVGGPASAAGRTPADASVIFIPQPSAEAASAAPPVTSANAVEASSPVSSERAMFILPDGRLSDDVAAPPKTR